MLANTNLRAFVKLNRPVDGLQFLVRDFIINFHHVIHRLADWDVSIRVNYSLYYK